MSEGKMEFEGDVNVNCFSEILRMETILQHEWICLANAIKNDFQNEVKVKINGMFSFERICRPNLMQCVKESGTVK